MNDQVKPKTNGDVLRECVRRVVGDRNAREVFADDDERETAFGAIAAEYDKARAQLPDDVEAFVAEAEARANAATLGPWAQPLEDEPRAIAIGGGLPISLLGLDVDGMAIVDDTDDAAFIVNARTDVPRLIAIIRAQGAELADMRARCEKLGNDILHKVEKSTGEDAEKIHGQMQRIAALESERDAMADRLAKLEKAAKEATDHLEGCKISHPDGVMLATYLLGELREMVKGAESGTTETR